MLNELICNNTCITNSHWLQYRPALLQYHTHLANVHYLHVNCSIYTGVVNLLGSCTATAFCSHQSTLSGLDRAGPGPWIGPVLDPGPCAVWVLSVTSRCLTCSHYGNKLIVSVSKCIVQNLCILRVIIAALCVCRWATGWQPCLTS